MKWRTARPDPDAGFTLDETFLARRKAAGTRRLNRLLITAVHATGFAILCGIAMLHDWCSDMAFPQPGLLWLVAMNLSFAAIACRHRRLALYLAVTSAPTQRYRNMTKTMDSA